MNAIFLNRDLQDYKLSELGFVGLEDYRIFVETHGMCSGLMQIMQEMKIESERPMQSIMNILLSCKSWFRKGNYGMCSGLRQII